jgi:hypothetical protein
MKLSEYLLKKLIKINRLVDPIGALTSFDIERWIIEWYKSEFNEVGCDGDIPKPRMPPTWLANWRKK